MLYENDVVMTPDHQLVRVASEGSSLVATLRNVFTLREVERRVDHVITEHGVVPNDDLYRTLRAASTNSGEIDLDALTSDRSQPQAQVGEGYSLYRVGDAVASRGIAAALYETRRLCQQL